MQSVPITTESASSNSARGEVYSLQHYVIKFVSDLRPVCCFLRDSGFLRQYNRSPRYNWNIVESGVNHHNHNQGRIQGGGAPGARPP